jgi:hypothetical protein
VSTSADQDHQSSWECRFKVDTQRQAMDKVMAAIQIKASINSTRADTADNRLHICNPTHEADVIHGKEADFYASFH